MNVRIAALAVAGIALLAATVAAHHNMTAVFDLNDRVALSGTLTKVDWRNPHIYYMVESKESGKAVLWKVEGYPPNMLVRRPEGWTREKVLARVGEEVSVTGWLARSGESAAHSRQFTFSDGTKMESGPAAGTGGPPQQYQQ